MNPERVNAIARQLHHVAAHRAEPVTVEPGTHFAGKRYGIIPFAMEEFRDQINAMIPHDARLRDDEIAAAIGQLQRAGVFAQTADARPLVRLPDDVEKYERWRALLDEAANVFAMNGESLDPESLDALREMHREASALAAELGLPDSMNTAALLGQNDDASEDEDG